MNRSSEKALSYLAGNENIDTITVDDLQKLVVENPYFPVTQFLLAKKLKGENEHQYSSQVQKTAIYFSNPLWLDYQLSGIDVAEEAGTFQSAGISAEDNPDYNIAKTEGPLYKEKEIAGDPFFTNEPTAGPDHTPEILPTPEAEAVALTNTVEAHSSPATAEQINTEETAGHKIVQAEEEMTAIARNTNEEADDFIDHLDATTATTEEVDVALPAELSPAAETEVLELHQEMAGVTRDTDKITEEFLEDAQEQEKNNGQPTDDEHDKMFQNIKAMLDASTEEAEADTKNAVIHIDPYYTIDYFASQGIKLELDQNPRDQLGQNLKKFTQWLRHMKKLGPEDATEVINRTETEADIQQIADSSNTVREVVTEAMATVLEKQGKKDKAIELYNKLTFLYPHKNAYFAGKIKNLKGI